MSERREHPRGLVSGVTIDFATATADAPTHGTVHNVGRGGLFISTDQRLPAGKAVTFELKTADGRTIEGAARIVWVREKPEGDRPAGIAVKFIDIDDSALAIIDGLVAAGSGAKRVGTTIGVAAGSGAKGERTAVGIGAPSPAPAQQRERTVLGIGTPEPPRPKLTRARTMLGIGAPAPSNKEEPAALEQAWDDVASELGQTAKEQGSLAAPGDEEKPVEEKVAAAVEEKKEAAPEPEKKEPEPEKKEPEPEKKEPEQQRQAAVRAEEPKPEPEREPVQASSTPEPDVEPEPLPKPAPKKEAGKATELQPQQQRSGSTLGYVLAVIVAIGAGAWIYTQVVAPPAKSGAPTVTASTATVTSAPPDATSAPPAASGVPSAASSTPATSSAAPIPAQDASIAATDAGSKDAATPKDGGKAAIATSASAAASHPKLVRPAPSRPTAPASDNPY